MKKIPGRLLAFSLVWLLGFCGGKLLASDLEVKPTGRIIAGSATLRLAQPEEFKRTSEKADYNQPATGDSSAAAGVKDAKEPPGPEATEWDPWEPFNDKMFWFNRQVDRFLIKPVATAYGKVVPDPVKNSISNALDNIQVVRRLVNNILQTNFGGAGREVARFTINSTVGVGGLFDVAGKWFDIEQSDKDTGQTLGVYGVGPGPYLILPLLSPLTVRDAFGFIADSAMDPIYYFIPWQASVAIDVTDTINDRALNLDKFEGVEESAVDLYSAVRSAYLQKRAAAVAAAVKEVTQTSEGEERKDLAGAVKSAKVSLEEALRVGESQGKPISAEFEIDEGKLQLSVFVIKDSKFYEVIVDHQTGRITDAEEMTRSADLADAKAQSEAIDKARLPLRAVTEQAVKENEGFRAVSAIPSLEEGHPVAEITLVKEKEFKTVSKNLD